MAIEKMKMVCISAPLTSSDLLIEDALKTTCYHPVLGSSIVNYTQSGIPEQSKNDYTDLKERIDHINMALSLGIKEVETTKEVSIEDAKKRVETIEKSYATYLNDKGRKSTEDDLKALKALEVYHLETSEDDFISIRFGRVPLSTMSSLTKYNQEKFVYSELNRDKYYAWIVYVCLKQDAKHFDDMFKGLYFEPIPIPNRESDGSIEKFDEMYSYIAEKSKKETFDKYMVIDGSICKFYAFVPYRNLEQFMSVFGDEVSVNYIDLDIDYPEIVIEDINPDLSLEYYYGKLPEANFEALKDRIDFFEIKKHNGYVYALYSVKRSEDYDIRKLLSQNDFIYALMDIRFERNEAMEIVDKGNITGNKTLVVPTKLKNNWLFKPFEMLVEMYGIPKYGTFDPTVFFGVTYSVLFGIMFGDLGQGIVISLVGFYMYKKKGMLLGAILERIGVLSAFFGLIYGSFFGNETILEPLLEPFGLPIHVGDASMTMTLLMVAVGLGVFLILSSMLINIVVLLKQKRYSEALFSQNGIAGFIFYGYVIFGAVMMLLGYPSVFTPVLLILCVGIPLVMILLAHPLSNLLNKKSMTPEHGWGGYLTESGFELFEVILSFLTNTMSFLRVAGFILSHVGMMMVIMQLHEMSGNAGILVMIFGNLLVIALEGLIVGIQTLRLEYYEMFSRYYESGGVKFESVLGGK